MTDTRDTLIRKLLNELPHLIADYEHCAPDADGHIDKVRSDLIKKVRSLLRRISMKDFGQ